MTEIDLSPLVPPEHMWSWVGGSGGYVEGGRAFFDYMVEKADLSPSSVVLDVGCGIGKHAIHFAQMLTPPGRYEGFDVEPKGIIWCQENITPRHPHVRFQHVDVRSGMYHPDAAGEADELRFPYDDATFDFVFLASVFSHMFFPDVTHYITEIERVLKPGGRMIATGYYMGRFKKAGIAAGTSAFSFAIPHQGSWLQTMDPPEAAVAQERPKFFAMLEERGLPVADVRNGQWHKLGVQDQDFVLARKPV